MARCEVFSVKFAWQQVCRWTGVGRHELRNWEHKLQDLVQVRFKKKKIWTRIIARETGQREFGDITEVEWREFVKGQIDIPICKG